MSFGFVCVLSWCLVLWFAGSLFLWWFLSALGFFLQFLLGGGLTGLGGLGGVCVLGASFSLCFVRGLTKSGCVFVLVWFLLLFFFVSQGFSGFCFSLLIGACLCYFVS